MWAESSKSSTLQLQNKRQRTGPCHWAGVAFAPVHDLHVLVFMMKYALIPVWIVQLFTQAKSFRSNPIIGNLWLNRCGLHVARIILAQAVMRLRFELLSVGIDKALKQSFYRDGYMVIENALPAEQFVKIKNEVGAIDAEVRECKQGDTLTHRILIDEQSKNDLPMCSEMLASENYLSLHKFASGKNGRPVSYIQTIKNHFIDGPADPQKNLHSDTFHPTMKSWYFLDDCNSDNGPFTYLPGSQRLTLARLKWEYQKSISICAQGDKYSSNGSFRATPEDLTSMGLGEPIGLSVPANTLVIANTHGFHRRGDAAKRSMRTEIWSISRSNPFNPFPGIDLPALARLQNRALTWYREYCDKKAAARGAESSWHIVPARNTLEDPQAVVREQEAA